MRYVFMLLLVVACSGEQKPTAPVGKAVGGQSQAWLVPDPSEVAFYADDPAWKTFTVRTDLDSVLVRANPSGSDPAVEIAGGSDAPTQGYCPAEGNDSPSRGRRDGWSLHVKACQVGRTKILLIDYDTGEVLQQYELNVDPTQTRLTGGQLQAWLEPDPSEVAFYTDDPAWKTFTVRTSLDSVLVRANPSGSDPAIEVAGGSDVPTRGYCPAEGNDSPSRGRRDGWNLHVKACQVGQTKILLIDYDTGEVLQQYELNVKGYPTETRLTYSEGMDRAPKWSPDGQRIVFYSERNGWWDIFSMDPDGSNQTQLTGIYDDRAWSNPGEWSPTWSPDGLQIAFVSQRDGHDSIHIMDADGTNEIRLTADNVHDKEPTWSPDGQYIAYVSNNATPAEPNRDIHVMDADGSNQKRLTRHIETDISPTWSPDGQKIAFFSQRDLVGYDIYVMDADGNNKRKLTQGNVWRGATSVPAWSPDGKRIAYGAFDSNFTAWIYVMDADGNNNKRITAGHDPAWSPDGKRIAFLSSDYHHRPRYRDSEIYVMDADGRNKKRLTYGDGNDTNPAWSPDGHSIVFESYRDGNMEIYVVDVP